MCLVEKMEEVEGFEPPRDLTPLSVFKTDPFSELGYTSVSTINNLSRMEYSVNSLIKITLFIGY